jgi:hypothetical protein
MSVSGTTSSTLDIEVMEAPLDPIVKGLLISAEIDLSIFTPSQFKLVFRGPRVTVLEMGGFQLGVPVNLQVTSGGVPTPLMTSAEVTSVEVEYGPDGNLTIVKGMDLSSRMMRGTTTMAYPEMTASEVVMAVVAESGVLPGEILPTSNTYEWLSQANVSAWVFVQQLAALENCVAYVDSMGLFNFGPMKQPEMGLPPVVSLDQPPMGTQLVMGRNLIRLRGRVTGAEQVPAVTVMGYDAERNLPALGVFAPMPSTSVSLDPATLPLAVAEEFEAEPFYDTSRPFDSVGKAMSRARSIAADIAGSLAELEGQCLGNSAIVAGEVVSLGMVGPPFDGQYVCTGARHVFEPELGGYTTWFNLGGRRDRSLYSLASGGSSNQRASRPTISGVVVGTVVDNEDPDREGRVKVMFPWLNPTYISAWARTVQIGAASTGLWGFLWLPEISDQVLIAFDRGDIDHPYVIGNLYTAIGSPEPGPQVEGVVGSRRITSRMLNQIEFDDGPEKMGITIQTGEGVCTISLDAVENNITIQSTLGQVTVQAMDSLTLQSDLGNISINAPLGQVSITGAVGVSVNSDAGQISAKAPAGVSLEGSTISLTSPSVSLGA